MANEITLPVGATAEHNTCGSCKYFQRKDDYNAKWGQCGFRLPPQVASRNQFRSLDRNYEYTGNEDQIEDISRCDLYCNDGKSYIVQRRVP